MWTEQKNKTKSRSQLGNITDATESLPSTSKIIIKQPLTIGSVANLGGHEGKYTQNQNSSVPNLAHKFGNLSLNSNEINSVNSELFKLSLGLNLAFFQTVCNCRS